MQILKLKKLSIGDAMDCMQRKLGSVRKTFEIFFPLLLVTLLATPAFAIAPPDKYYHLKADQERLDKKGKDLAADLTKLKADLVRAEKNYRDKKVLADAAKGFDTVGTGGTEYIADAERARTDLEGIKKRIGELDAELNRVNERRTNILAEINKDPRIKVDPAEQIAQLNLEVQAAKSGMGIADLKGESNEVEIKLNKIETEMGQSEVGAYVRDKIGQLMNSQVACKLRERCDAPKSKVIRITGDQINEIFPEMATMQHRQDYRGTVDSRKAKPAPATAQ